MTSPRRLGNIWETSGRCLGDVWDGGGIYPYKKNIYPYRGGGIHSYMGRFIFTGGGFNVPGGSSKQKQLPILGRDLHLQVGFILAGGISLYTWEFTLTGGIHPCRGNIILTRGDLPLQDGAATLHGGFILTGGDLSLQEGDLR